MPTTLLELLMDWVVPIGGGVLTVVVIKSAGLTSSWWMLLALPRAFAFQWALLLILTGMGTRLPACPPKRDG
jgi:hypothetical protein